MRMIRASIVLLFAAAVSLPVAAHALEVDRQACTEAYETGQKLRLERRLFAAKRALFVCAQPGCPSAAQKDCTRWIAELQDEVPSIVLGARDHLGRDLRGVLVFVDSSTVAERLDGRALELDPGEHQFRFEIEGEAPIAERAVLREGEKRRAITVTLEPKLAERSRIIPDAPEPKERATSLRVYVPAGAAAIGIAGFVFFGLSARADESRLERRCKPSCSDDEIAGLRRNIAAADVSLVVALIGAGVATYFYLSERE